MGTMLRLGKPVLKFNTDLVMIVDIEKIMEDSEVVNVCCYTEAKIPFKNVLTIRYISGRVLKRKTDSNIKIVTNRR